MSGFLIMMGILVIVYDVFYAIDMWAVIDACIPTVVMLLSAGVIMIGLGAAFEKFEELDTAIYRYTVNANKVVQDTYKQNARLDRQATIYLDGSWQCSCGRHNSNIVSTCACGINKRECQ